MPARAKQSNNNKKDLLKVITSQMQIINWEHDYSLYKATRN